MKKTAAAVAVSVLITACSGTGGTIPVSGQKPAEKGVMATAKVSLTLPAPAKSSSARRLYVSSYTNGVAISGYPTGSMPPSTATVADVSANSPLCSTNNDGSRSCEVPVSLPAGTDDVVIQAYDQKPTNNVAQGSLLSQGTDHGVTIVANQANVIAVTLDGVVSSFTIGSTSLAAPADATNHMFSIYANAFDADGELIVAPGNYSTPISLVVSGDANSTIGLSSSQITGPDSTVTATYSGGALGTATIAASAGSLHSSNSLTFSPANYTVSLSTVAAGQNSTITVTEAAYGGTFSASTSDATCATVSPSTATATPVGSPVVFTLTGVGAGSQCTISITSDTTVSVPITVSNSSARINVEASGNNWTEFHHDDQHTGYSPQTTITKTNVATLKPKWQQTDYGVFANALVVNGVVYQADLGGYVYAWNMSNGRLIWTFHDAVSGDSFQSTPEYVNGTLYLGSYGLANSGYPSDVATFYAINATTGQQVWQYATTQSVNASFQGSPTIRNGVIYQGLATSSETSTTCMPNNQVIALNQGTGQLESVMNLTASGVTGADVWSTPTFDPAGNMFVATGNLCGQASGPAPYGDAVLRVNAAVGTPPNPLPVQWAFQSTSGPGPSGDVDFGATPVYVNGKVIEGGKDGNVYAIDANTGATIWTSYQGAILGTPATDGTRVYVPVTQTMASCAQGSVCGSLVALNVSDGSVAWSVPTHEDQYQQANLASPVISQGMVFAAYDSAFWALDANTGKTLWTYPIGHVIYGGLTLVNGGLLTGSFDGSAFFLFTPNGT